MRSSNALESCTWAPVSAMASGTPLASVRTCRFDPGLPRSRGLGPVLVPPFGRDRSRIQAAPRPVDQSGFAQFVKQDAVQTILNSGLLPVPEPPPARHP